MKLEEIGEETEWGVWTEIFERWYSAEYVSKNGPAPRPRREDVEDVIWWTQSSPEGYASTDFAAIMKLVNGQYAMVEAWCDTTGFDCCGNVLWKIGPTLDSVIMELSVEYAVEARITV